LWICSLDNLDIRLLAVRANDDLLLLVIGLSSSREPSATRFTTWRDGVVAQMFEGILVWALVSIQEPHAITRCAHHVVRRAHRRVTGIGSRYPDHPIDVLLDVLDKSLDHIDLTWTREDQSLNSVVDLLFVLAGIAHFQEFLLVGPLSRLSIRIRLILVT